MVELHERCARVASGIIADVSAESISAQPEALLLCTHAAVLIALARALTNAHWVAGDFKAFTCGVSKFVRSASEDSAGGASWSCEINGGVEHLSGGGERDW